MKKIHCVGIGGIGLSALASVLKAQGDHISGSDREASSLINKLEKMGIKIQIGHEAKLVKDTDVVVHSLAIPKSNPELKEARHLGIPILSYPQALGELTKHYYTIAVCGTHGKSTVTSMIAKTLIENDFDPTVVVGTQLKELGGMNFRVGKKGKILLIEACEYKRAFLNYNPRVLVLHTLDPDHLDYYKDFAGYLRAFQQFTYKLPRDGYFFGNLDDEDIHDVLQGLQAKRFPAHNIFTYGREYAAGDFYLKKNSIIKNGKLVGELKLKIPGDHNRTNALAAFAVCSTLGMAPAKILHSLNAYKGSARRFEIKGKKGKLIVIDDYAHHPAEIQATLQAAREKFPSEKICVVFQPHQYSRTKKFLKEFGAAFGGADAVVVPNIYEVRDSAKDKASISAEKLVAEIKHNHKNVHFGGGISRTVEFLRKNSGKFDIVFTMGAGDVWKIGETFLKS